VNPVEITVRGSHAVTLPPEQATVYATVSADGVAPQPVFDAVATALSAVSESLQARHHPKKGPVTKFVVDQIRRGSHHPFNRDGEQLPLVHTASVSIIATFTDFDELAAWAGGTAGVPGVGIGYIDWALTDATRVRAERKIRQKAVRDARRRAQDYADALDLGKVAVRAISDPGLGVGPTHRKVMMASAVGDSMGGAPEVSLRPDDVHIEAQVEATFIVS
jgi:uncharacterized protein YggE